MEQGTKLGWRIQRSVTTTVQSARAPAESDGDKLDDGYDDRYYIKNKRGDSIWTNLIKKKKKKHG